MIRANKLLTPEEAFGERAKDVDFKPKRSLEEELDVLKEKVRLSSKCLGKQIKTSSGGH